MRCGPDAGPPRTRNSSPKGPLGKRRGRDALAAETSPRDLPCGRPHVQIERDGSFVMSGERCGEPAFRVRLEEDDDGLRGDGPGEGAQQRIGSERRDGPAAFGRVALDVHARDPEMEARRARGCRVRRRAPTQGRRRRSAGGAAAVPRRTRWCFRRGPPPGGRVRPPPARRAPARPAPRRPASAFPSGASRQQQVRAAATENLEPQALVHGDCPLIAGLDAEVDQRSTGRAAVLDQRGRHRGSVPATPFAVPRSDRGEIGRAARRVPTARRDGLAGDGEQDRRRGQVRPSG